MSPSDPRDTTPAGPATWAMDPYGTVCEDEDTASSEPTVEAPATPQPSDDLPRYDLRSVLGRGGMGEVWLAWDRSLRRHVALKAIHAHLGRAEELASRFQAEAQATAQLQHPSIVPVHDVGVLPDGRPFYTMRVITGQDLHTLLDGLHAVSTRARWGTPDSGVSFLDLCDAYQQVCEAVAWAHSRGVLHRDLKPENIMVGDYGQVLVVDWGLAKVLGSASDEMPEITTARSSRPDLVTRYGRVSGTPGYMAPEQARGETDALGPRTDVFALGGILFTLLAGRPPTPDEEPATALAVFPRVDAALRELCVHAMELDPADRPADAAVLSERFGAWRRGAREAAQQSAAAAEAEAAYRTLPTGLQAALPSFLARLVGPDGDARPTSVWAAPDGALETLEAVRLVAREGEEARLVDPALPRTWNRLRGWVEANPERHQQLHLLIEASRAWTAAGQPARLLWTDREAVADAQRTLRARTESEDAFLSASAQLFSRQQSRRRALATAVGLVVASAAVVSTVQWRSAVQARNSETAARLAAESRALEAQSQERVLAGTPLAAAVTLQGASLLTPDPAARAASLDQARALAAGSVGTSGVFGRHTAPLISLDWSPAGTQVVSGDSSGAVHLWSADTLETRASLQLGAATKRVRWSPKGDTLAIADIEGTIQTYAADSGALLQTLPSDQGWRPALHYLPDGRLITARPEGDVLVVNPTTGAVQQTLVGHGHYVFHVDFDGDRQRLVTASVDQTVRLWDLPTGAPGPVLEHPVQLLKVALALGGDRLVAIGVESPQAWLWDPNTGVPVAELVGHKGKITGVAVSPDGSRIATTSLDGTTRLWQAEDGALVRTLAAAGAPAWNPGGRLLALAGSDGQTRLFDGTTGARMGTLPAHPAGLSDVAWDPSGTRVLTGDSDGGVRVSAPRVATVQTTDLCEPGVLDGELSPDERTLAVTSTAYQACVVPLTGNKPAEILGPTAAWVFWSPTGDQLLGGVNTGPDTGLWSWRPGGNAPVGIGGTLAPRSGIGFGEGGTRFLVLARDYTLRALDAATGTETARLDTGARAYQNRIEGDRLLVWNHDHTTEVWDLPSETRLLRDDDTARLGTAMLLGPQGRWLAWETARGVVGRLALGTTAADSGALAWETPVGGIVQSLARDPGGTTLAATLSDSTVVLLDAADGQVQRRFPSPATDAELRFGPMGERLVLRAEDGTVDVRRTDDGALLLRIGAGAGGGVAHALLLASGPLLTVGQDGAARQWPLPDPPPVPGDRTNQRICRDGRLVSVVPWPEPSPIWAPEAACGGGT